MQDENLRVFTPHSHQRKVLDAKERFLVVVCGVQSGKTTVGGAWLLNEIKNHVKQGYLYDYLIAAPTVKMLEQSTLPKFNELFPPSWGRWKEKKGYYETTWNRRIYVRSLDEPNHIEGMTIGGAWLDEVGQAKQLSWINVQARLAIHRGRCLMTTTPYNMGWFYRDVYKKAGTHDIKLFSWPSISNPYFPKEDIERMQSILPESVFSRRYLGEFTPLEGLVYPDFSVDECVVPPYTLLPESERFAGLDFGFANPTCLICVALHPKTNEYVVYREFYKSGATVRELADIIKAEKLKYVLADPQSAQLISELQNGHGCYNVRPADNTIDVGIERISALLKEKRLKVFKTCFNFIEEIEGYHYQEPSQDRVVKDKPKAIKNHAMDALRYSLSKNVSVTNIYHGGFTPTHISRPRHSSQLYVNQADKYTGYL
jgi:PBSX family phage terminase large subunit